MELKQNINPRMRENDEYSCYFLGLSCQVNKEIYQSLRTPLPLLSAIRRDVVKGCG